MVLKINKEKIKILREELINSLDSYEDEKNPHTPTKEELKHLRKIFKEMISYYDDVREIEKEIPINVIDETHEIAKRIITYDPMFMYIHKDIIYYMGNLPPGVAV